MSKPVQVVNLTKGIMMGEFPSAKEAKEQVQLGLPGSEGLIEGDTYLVVDIIACFKPKVSVVLQDVTDKVLNRKETKKVEEKANSIPKKIKRVEKKQPVVKKEEESISELATEATEREEVKKQESETATSETTKGSSAIANLGAKVETLSDAEEGSTELSATSEFDELENLENNVSTPDVDLDKVGEDLEF